MLPRPFSPRLKVVGSIDQMEVDGPASADANSGLSGDAKNSGKAPNSEKKRKRKLYVGTQALGYHRDHMEVISPFKDGIEADWDIVHNIWDHAFRDCLLIDPKVHPMLLAGPSANHHLHRERCSHLLFPVVPLL